jgi:membrane protease subunit HflK
MTEHKDKKIEDQDSQLQGNNKVEELDTAGKSLSEALQISFAILKVIMIVLIVAFLASGFETVGSDERALVLRFGKIQGVGEERLLGPGPHWVFPYPIDEIIKIPVEKKVNLAIDSFWYFQTESEKLSGQSRPVRPDQPLDPTTDGYCITRSEKGLAVDEDTGQEQEDVLNLQFRIYGRSNDANSVNVELEDLRIDSRYVGSDGSDYNIVHSKWQLTYQIYDPERFFKNIYVEDVPPGQTYFDVATKNIEPLLRQLFERAVVTTMVDYTIDEAIASKEGIAKNVRDLTQTELEKIQSGIRIISVYLTDITWPRQVNAAFQASISASQTSQKAITEARSYAENTLSEAAGPVADQLYDALHNDTVTEQQQEQMWQQAAGNAQEVLSNARAYSTEVVETARANADYLQRLLPEYRKHPKLVIQKIYLDAIEYVLEKADEKFVIQPTEGTKGREIRIQLSRDSSIKQETSEQK